MMISVFLIVMGFTLLIFGANWMVEGASSLARKYKVSDLVIGLTIVAFGTSAPEMVVNIIASSNGYSDIVLGNILGSNNFNLFLVLGLSGMIFPIKVASTTAWREIPISLGVSVLLLLLFYGFSGGDRTMLSLVEGLVLLVLFMLFLYYVFTQLKSETKAPTEKKEKAALNIWGLIVLGLAGLVIGGRLVVDNSVAVAAKFGVSEKIIGLTIVAAGTSLPELVTSVVAALKKNSDIAIGNVIGSNVFNILLILGLSSLVNPVVYTPKFDTDLFILIGGTLFLLTSMLTGQRKTLDRWEAAFLFVFYLSYMVYLVMKEL
ncbi:calcium/sodium antiporter [Marinilabilia rubra]|uniref:Sodium:proton exchanger n=1 Tax=Marinilabilia rubra TaxID=2162893 RepID=A0A2U2B9D7_9BACT|nr:calcium/sodium antiporter [Marinilabilia rubra]PWD99689.1 sodium:proton exchanger [Marinilabilia rubra]